VIKMANTDLLVRKKSPSHDLNQVLIGRLFHATDGQDIIHVVIFLIA
jgi:hypothetical protein